MILHTGAKNHNFTYSAMGSELLVTNQERDRGTMMDSSANIDPMYGNEADKCFFWRSLERGIRIRAQFYSFPSSMNSATPKWLLMHPVQWSPLCEGTVVLLLMVSLCGAMQSTWT